MGNCEPRFRLRPLCACLAAASTLIVAETALASTVSVAALSAAAARVQRGSASVLLGSTVTDCNDAQNPGPGSLRYLVAHAVPGDIIDIGSCPVISLSGGIATPPFTPLTISGSGGSTIQASATEPAIAGLSNLTLANLTVIGGAAIPVVMNGDRVGGAVVGAYNLTLQNSTISGGVAKGKGGKGGSIYAFGDVTLQNSTISGGSAVLAGGCIYGKGSVVLEHSTVTGCSANAFVVPAYLNASITAFGGGIVASSLTITNASLVSSSFSLGSPSCFYPCYYDFTADDGLAGGIKTGTFTCSDSRVSGNQAVTAAGISAFAASLDRCTVDNNFFTKHLTYGDYTSGSGLSVSGSAQIVNSTFARNGFGIDAGAYLTLEASTVAYNCLGGVSSPSLLALSSIVAKNSTYVDFLNCYGSDVNASAFSGADNLVMTTNLSQAPPPGVITVTADPLLLPLASNGGPTPTYALDLGSPARDKGSNFNKLASDQRGAGFVRAYGRPDIGAYEWQVEGDEIFYDGLDYGGR